MTLTYTGTPGDDLLDPPDHYPHSEPVVVLGQAGNDHLVAPTLHWEVALFGGPGDDRLESDAVFGGDLFGGAGNDVLVIAGGGHGNFLGGDDGDDVLIGGDAMNGGAGNDRMEGLPGSTQYWVDSPGDVIVEDPAVALGSDKDVVYASVSWTLGAHLDRLYLQGSAVSGTGNALDNEIYDTPGDNTLRGLDGDDILGAGSGDDVVDGGAGQDMVVFFNAGLPGQAPPDPDIRVNLTIAGPQDTGFGRDTLIGIESVATGTGSDVLIGNAADNTLIGLAGDDVLVAGAGRDVLDGGAGNDTYYVDGFDGIIERAYYGGIDTVVTAVNHVLPGTIETLLLTGGLAVSGTGNGLDNWIEGNGAANLLAGGGGRDTLVGSGGADRLYGAGGADILRGGDAGGAAGGAGDGAGDAFLFKSLSESTPGAGRDAILDFRRGEDAIDLGALDADLSAPGDQAFRFAGATPGAHAVWVVSLGGGDVLLRADVTGNGVADLEIEVRGVGTLGAGDLVL